MAKKKTVLILLLAFVLLLAGAYAAYSWLSGAFAPDQLGEVSSPAPTEATPGASESPAVSASPAPSASPEAAMAPDFTVYDGEGEPVALSDFYGKPIVVNFWASWCGPCQREMPDFQEKYLELGEDVHFLMVNATGGRETLQSAMDFIAEQGYTFPVYYDTSGEASMAYGIYSLPQTFFIDAQGHAVARASGTIDGDTLQRGIDMITS